MVLHGGRERDDDPEDVDEVTEIFGHTHYTRTRWEGDDGEDLVAGGVQDSEARGVVRFPVFSCPLALQVPTWLSGIRCLPAIVSPGD